MSNLNQFLEQIQSSLLKLNRPVVKAFQHGLSEADLQNLQDKFGLKFTEELRDLYRWHNGTKVTEGDVLDDVHFFPGFYFISAAEALKHYKSCQKDPRWDKTWFPIFTNDAGDFYAVSCGKSMKKNSEVIGFLNDEEEQMPEYESLTTMMRSLVEGFSKKVIFVDSDGTLEIDDDKYQKIAQKFNPEIELWQD